MFLCCNWPRREDENIVHEQMVKDGEEGYIRRVEELEKMTQLVKHVVRKSDMMEKLTGEGYGESKKLYM